MVEVSREKILAFIDEKLFILYLQEKYVPIQVHYEDGKEVVEENYYDAEYESYDGFVPALWCEACGDHFRLRENLTLEEICIDHYLDYHAEQEEE